MNYFWKKANLTIYFRLILNDLKCIFNNVYRFHLRKRKKRNERESKKRIKKTARVHCYEDAFL